jgi:NADPH:quinone reductase-like Zn-dependent oxidoreductase
VQIARARGARVTAVCSAANAALVASLGAARVVDYTHEDVFALGRCFDVVFDTVGTFSPRSVARVLAPGGRFVSIVNSAWNIVATLVSRLPGVPLSRTTTFVALPIGRHLEEIGRLVEAGAIRPVIDRTFAVEDIAAAIAYSKTGRARGKIVLTLS